jgi:hypothetical protein
VLFKVIDSLFIGASLLGKKNCWASLLGKFFFRRFEMCSLQVLYLHKFKFGSHEPLDYDRVWYALQKCSRDLPSIFEQKTWKKMFFSKDNFFPIYFARASLLGSKKWLNVVIKESIPNNDSWTPSSYTADFSVITREKREIYISLERGVSKDHACIKISSIECKMAVHRFKQVKWIFLRRY